MKTTVTESSFIETFRRVRPEQFSVPALRALFQYLEEIDRESEQEMEFDVIALCCDFCEYDSATEACEAYGEQAADDVKATDWLSERTQVIPFNGGIVIGNF